MKINPSIQTLITGKSEQDAVDCLKKFNCNWKIIARDGTPADSSEDRDDRRYGLIIVGGFVTRVLAG